MRRSVCFLVSDFLATGFEPSLRIARRRHDLIPVVVTDPREGELPNVGFVELEDAETGEVMLVDTGSASARASFAKRWGAIAAARQTMFRKIDTETIEVRTDRSYVEPLVRFFHKRERRR